MDYINKLHNLVKTLPNPEFYQINKIQSLKDSSFPFSYRANQNFITDMKYELVSLPSKLRFKYGPYKFKTFDEFWENLSQMNNYKISDFVKYPDPNIHKICISLPENEDHLNHLQKCMDDETYGFLKPQRYSRPPLRGGYHARTTINIVFDHVYTTNRLLRFVRQNIMDIDSFEKIKNYMSENLDKINYVLDYIGGLESDHHKITNKSKVIQYIQTCETLANIEDCEKLYQLVVDNKISTYFSGTCPIKVMFKDESSLLQFIFIKDRTDITFTSTAIFRNYKEDK